MDNFKQYLERKGLLPDLVFGNEVYRRIRKALFTFLENRQGLLQRLGPSTNATPEGHSKYFSRPFKKLTWDGITSKDALESAISMVEKLSKNLDRYAGRSLYEALSNLIHMADNQSAGFEVMRYLTWLLKIDDAREQSKSNQS